MSGVSDALRAIKEGVDRIFVGNDRAVTILLATAIAGGHALLVGPIGSGKTTLAKALAKAIGGTFKRIQVTNETLPSDILGFVAYSRDGEARVVRGPIFANVVLLDEVNRAPPRTLSALLEAMQEGQVTLDGSPIQLPSPHVVLATMNAEEIALGVTNQLPAAVLDRFTASLHIGYASREDEKAVLANLNNIEQSLASGDGLIPIEWFRDLIRYTNGIYADDAIIEYVMGIVEAIRGDGRLLMPLSTRAPISVLKLAKALAVLDGRNYVVPDDVKEAAEPALAHRVVPKPEHARTLSPAGVIREALESVPPPVYLQRA